MMNVEAVCFDMDGTLIRNTDSVNYLCMLNSNADEHKKIERLEHDKAISWIEADHLKAKLIDGLELKDVESQFVPNVELIENIDRVLAFLREKRIKSVLITTGPSQVAEIVGRMFSFDGVYGSTYEVKDSKFTGRIMAHLENHGKLKCLRDFCAKNDFALNRCVAVGDSQSDIDVFERCGKSIAINYSDALEGRASAYIITDDLADIIGMLESWIGSPG